MLTRNQWILERIHEVFPRMPIKQYKDDKNLLQAYTCWCVFGAQNWDDFHIYMDARNRTLIYGGVHPVLVR